VPELADQRTDQTPELAYGSRSPSGSACKPTGDAEPGGPTWRYALTSFRAFRELGSDCGVAAPQSHFWDFTLGRR
jgi:hypothetical protein